MNGGYQLTDRLKQLPSLSYLSKIPKRYQKYCDGMITVHAPVFPPK